MGDYYNQFFGDCEMIVKKYNSLLYFFLYLLFHTIIHHHTDTQPPTL